MEMLSHKLTTAQGEDVNLRQIFALGKDNTYNGVKVLSHKPDEKNLEDYSQKKTKNMRSDC